MTQREFSQFVTQYEKLVFTICYQFVKDYHEAQNLSQETFLSAYRHIDSYQGDNYKPWIARIATNKAKDYLNSAYSRRVMLASSEEDSVEDMASMRAADFSEQPDEAYIQKEGSNAIEQMIRSLKEPYREVCILRFLEEKDTQEIAQILGRPKKTVETQLYRARAILQKQIKEVYSYEKKSMSRRLGCHWKIWSSSPLTAI